MFGRSAWAEIIGNNATDSQAFPTKFGTPTHSHIFSLSIYKSLASLKGNHNQVTATTLLLLLFLRFPASLLAKRDKATAIEEKDPQAVAD
jgi:hypothetical protein